MGRAYWAQSAGCRYMSSAAGGGNDAGAEYFARGCARPVPPLATEGPPPRVPHLSARCLRRRPRAPLAAHVRLRQALCPARASAPAAPRSLLPRLRGLAQLAPQHPAAALQLSEALPPALSSPYSPLSSVHKQLLLQPSLLLHAMVGGEWRRLLGEQPCPPPAWVLKRRMSRGGLSVRSARHTGARQCSERRTNRPLSTILALAVGGGRRCRCRSNGAGSTACTTVQRCWVDGWGTRWLQAEWLQWLVTRARASAAQVQAAAASDEGGAECSHAVEAVRADGGWQGMKQGHAGHKGGHAMTGGEVITGEIGVHDVKQHRG